MSTRFHNLLWAVLLEAGFASMLQDQNPQNNRFHREAYIESAAIMQATRDIRAERYHQCASYLPPSD